MIIPRTQCRGFGSNVKAKDTEEEAELEADKEFNMGADAVGTYQVSHLISMVQHM